MTDYAHFTITALDRSGKSKLKFEGQDYEEVKERIKRFIDYIYKSEKQASFHVEAIVEDTLTHEREFKRSDHSTTLSNFIEFLKYIYEVEEVEEAERKGYPHSYPPRVGQGIRYFQPYPEGEDLFTPQAQPRRGMGPLPGFKS